MAIRSRRKAGLPTEAMSVWGVKVGGLALVVLIAVWLLNQERQRATAIITIQGVPWVVPLVPRSSSRLRSCSAAPRSAATSTPSAATPRPHGAPASTCANVKTVCFVLCSTLAVVAGILIASRDNSVSPTTGGARRCCTRSGRP